MPNPVRFASVYNPNVIVSFTNPFDIQEMRKHSEYVEVKEEKQQEQKETPQVESKPEAVADVEQPAKRGRGRPRKVTAEV
jgi:hypothetical protein